MSLEKGAQKALKAFFRVMDGPASHQRAEAALTLHMLEFLAPRFFAEHKLARARSTALASLTRVPTTFGPGVDADEAMARIDALYLRKVRGLKPRRFQAAAVKGAIAAAEQEAGTLTAWLMGELVVPLGVSARVALADRWPFQREHRVLHLYHLTHRVLLGTAYLMTPVPATLIDELVELQAALEGLQRLESWDLLGECVFCLNRAGTPTLEAVDVLLEAQRPNGTFAEADSLPRSTAHCTAVGVLALAGALDLARTAS